MGGGMEADLSHGAVAEMSRLAVAKGPPPVVLQVAAVGRATDRYGLLLSDGVHSQDALLVVSMSSHVTAGRLRVGSVVRLLDYYVCSSLENWRVIIVIQLEVLQTECTLIRSPSIYEVNAAEPNIGSYSDILRVRAVSRFKQGVTGIACSRDQSFSGSSRASGVKHAVDKLHTFYGLVAAQNTIDAKMQQLSLNPHQGQRLAVPSIGGGSYYPDNTYHTIAQIKDENFQMLGQPDLITVVAAISHVNTDSFCYPACKFMFNGKKCSKKVTFDGDGWWCTRCLWRSETCEYRYMFACQIHDHTGSTYATVIHEAAEDIIGHTERELLDIKNGGQYGAKFEKIMQGIFWRQHILKLRIEEEAGHGVKRSIVKAQKLNSPDICGHVLGLIDDMLKSNSSSASLAHGIVTPSVFGSNLKARPTVRTSDRGNCSPLIQ